MRKSGLDARAEAEDWGHGFEESGKTSRRLNAEVWAEGGVCADEAPR